MKVVVCDADSLFGHTTRALFLHLAHEGVVRVQWSRLILEECSRALRKMGRFVSHEERMDHIHALEAALPQASVPVFEVHRHLRSVWQATDTSDQHVAACAVAVRALGRAFENEPVYISTKNTRDFKPKRLLPLGVVVHKPDVILLDLLKTHPVAFGDAFRKYREARTMALDAAILVDRLKVDGNRATAAALHLHLNEGTLAL